MQLGNRFPLGGPVPAGLPHVVEIAIQAVEEELAALGEDNSGWRWTLTWLEAQPVLELDDGTVIRYNPGEDSATITQPAVAVEDDEDWI
ncbi:hypothetical protein RCH16_000902 [Cryobacterium sp. MP_M5]|uniref:hypothetical protein n=1 Tax=unclassified Cryobacterium TaxID=2649013 RepID=UPI0018C997D2|nr:MULTISPECIES: hypothetical protein [unclassified Cryobacterium]MBG6057576.1 hypothetical protein [Cryobacterium sp. MP_M3]MEC5175909.1 hypothetical protein [Cryobacterium sp. MP_M5]